MSQCACAKTRIYRQSEALQRRHNARIRSIVLAVRGSPRISCYHLVLGAGRTHIRVRTRGQTRRGTAVPDAASWRCCASAGVAILPLRSRRAAGGSGHDLEPLSRSRRRHYVSMAAPGHRASVGKYLPTPNGQRLERLSTPKRIAYLRSRSGPRALPANRRGRRLAEGEPATHAQSFF
jgi:hypothetical protein